MLFWHFLVFIYLFLFQQPAIFLPFTLSFVDLSAAVPKENERKGTYYFWSIVDFSYAAAFKLRTSLFKCHTVKARLWTQGHRRISEVSDPNRKTNSLIVRVSWHAEPHDFAFLWSDLFSAFILISDLDLYAVFYYKKPLATEQPKCRPMHHYNNNSMPNHSFLKKNTYFICFYKYVYNKIIYITI